MKKLFIFLIIVSFKQTIFSQGVKIGGTGDPDATAILEIDGGSGKGFLLPRMTSTSMNALNATDGMVVYNSTDASIYLRKNGAWQKIAEGNAGGGGFTLPLVAGQNFSGYMLDLTNTSTNTFSGAIRGYSENGAGIIGGSYSGRGGYFSSATGHALITGVGNVGIGTPSPMARMHAAWNLSELLQLENTSPLVAGMQVRELFKIGSYYTGGIGTTGQTQTSARLSFYTGTGVSTSSFGERMSILNNGNVGINNITPLARLDVNGKTILNQNFDNAAVEIKGAIKVSGSVPAAFVVHVPPISSGDGFPTPSFNLTIDNPACNGKPAAMLFVTMQANAANKGQTVVVKYDFAIAKWKLFPDGFEQLALAPDTYFNVLVIDK